MARPPIHPEAFPAVFNAVERFLINLRVFQARLCSETFVGVEAQKASNGETYFVDQFVLALFVTYKIVHVVWSDPTLEPPERSMVLQGRDLFAELYVEEAIGATVDDEITIRTPDEYSARMLKRLFGDDVDKPRPGEIIRLGVCIDRRVGNGMVSRKTVYIEAEGE